MWKPAPELIFTSLGALDETLRPQASAASRGGIAKTVLLIGVRHLTTVAGYARGKIKFYQALSQSHILRVMPDFLE